MTAISAINWPVKFGLRVAASWPGTPLPVMHKLFWLLILITFQIFQYSYVIMHYKSDTLIETIDTLGTCLSFSLVLIKLCIAWIHPNLVNDILSVMEEECQKYTVLDTHNLISKTIQLSYRLTNFVMCTSVMSTILFALAILIFQENGTSKKLIVKMDLPFDFYESSTYGLVLIIQYVCQVMSAYTFSAFTSFLLIAVLHAGCQIDIMCRRLLDVPYENTKQLKLFIKRHQEIIMFTEKIEKFFMLITLTELLSDTLVTCCLSYLIVIALQTENGTMLIKSVVFYILMCSDAFIYCFAGEYLSIKSKVISDTAYEFLWYNLHPNESQLLIVVILRAQKGFTFTFGKFATLSMESFAAIMKASASYMSVLLAMT
ncbi:odorant receptor 10-like [Xylocopa sonorina]|uniref:odorant receptor 10-like n=1 Tax=Xylocopa sonorina TaxID=1818115 RepID=UPI00403AF5FC